MNMPKLLDEEEQNLKTMGILTSPKSKALVAHNEGSSNLASQSSNKGKGKNQKWKKYKLEMQKRQHQNPLNKASLPQILTRRGTTIRRRKSVPIVRNWVMKSMTAISNRLMS